MKTNPTHCNSETVFLGYRRVVRSLQVPPQLPRCSPEAPSRAVFMACAGAMHVTCPPAWVGHGPPGPWMTRDGDGHHHMGHLGHGQKPRVPWRSYLARHRSGLARPGPGQARTGEARVETVAWRHGASDGASLCPWAMRSAAHGLAHDGRCAVATLAYLTRCGTHGHGTISDWQDSEEERRPLAGSCGEKTGRIVCWQDRVPILAPRRVHVRRQLVCDLQSMEAAHAPM
jgi:hypothetical protein